MKARLKLLSYGCPIRCVLVGVPTMASRCEAYQDRTGQHVCRRCGYYWDSDDTAPDCKTEQELKDEKIAINVKHGRETLKHLKDMLK